MENEKINMELERKLQLLIGVLDEKALEIEQKGLKIIYYTERICDNTIIAVCEDSDGKRIECDIIKY